MGVTLRQPPTGAPYGVKAYPEISIADGRQPGTVNAGTADKGLDPLEEKGEVKEKKPASPLSSLEIAARQVHEHYPGWRNPKHGKQWISTLEQYAFPLLGHQSIDTISPAHIASVLQPIWLSIRAIATRVKQRLRCRDGLGLGPGSAKQILSMSLDKLLPQQPSKTNFRQHQPAMDWRVLPEFYKKAFGQLPKSLIFSRALLSFWIFTACHSGEAKYALGRVRPENAIWTIPARQNEGTLPTEYRCLFRPWQC